MARTHQRLIGWALVLALSLAACADVRAAGRQHTTPVVVKVERGGFHWSDAGIGVLAGAGLSLTAYGCLALTRLRDADRNTGTRGDES
jgi:hypothetical protein